MGQHDERLDRRGWGDRDQPRGPAGQPVEVATNTGCSPKAWNKFYVRSAGGVTPASAALVKTVLAASYGGDWRPIGEQHAFGG